jgi:chromosome segregation ATPase
VNPWAGAKKMKKNMLVLIFSLMIGAVIFSVLRYIAVSRVKARLEYELSQVKEHAWFLEGQLKQDEELISGLNEEKRLLTDTLKGKESRISQLEQKNTQSQEHIFSLVNEIEGARKQRDKTMQDLSASQEKLKELQTRLQSIPELKKAIKEVKMQMRNRRLKTNHSSEPLRQISEAESNFGYLLKDGASTYKPRIKIEVTPAQ